MIDTAISLSTRGHFRILKSGHFNFLLTVQRPSDLCTGNRSSSTPYLASMYSTLPARMHGVRSHNAQTLQCGYCGRTFTCALCDLTPYAHTGTRAPVPTRSSPRSVSISPGAPATDEKAFPLVWQAATGSGLR